MNVNFDNLPSLNGYLAESMEHIQQAEDKQAEINNLIQVMRLNEGLLTPTTTQTKDLVHYLKLAESIRKLTKADGNQVDPILENVIRVAIAQFTHLDKKQTDLSMEIINELNGVSRETYLQTMAAWIAENKIPLNTLYLSKGMMLELAPHLTYLNISLSAYACRQGKAGHADEFDDEFDRAFLKQLLENSKILKTLIMNKCFGIDESVLAALKNTQHLQEFSTKGSFVLMNGHIRQFLLPIYLEDRERALKLIDSQNENYAKHEDQIQELHMLGEYFTLKGDPGGSEVRDLLKQINSELLHTMLSRDDIPFVKDDLLKNDPVQQLYIYQLCSRLSSEQIPDLKKLLTPLIKSPMDQPLKRFYQRLAPLKSGVALGRIHRIAASLGDRNEILRCLPYLFSDTKQAVIWKNLTKLDEAGQLEQFLKVISLESLALTIDDLFTENPEDNLMKWAFLKRVQPYLETSLFVDDDDTNRMFKNLLNLQKTGHFDAFDAKVFPSEGIANILLEENFFTDDGNANLTKVKSMLYLPHVSKRERISLLKNVEFLLMTHQFGPFYARFAPDVTSASILATEGLFTEDGEENARVIGQLYDLQKEFATFKNVMPISNMPWTREAESLAQTAVGKAFIKVHLSEFVKEPQLQDIVLKTFPPSNPKNVKLYPVRVTRSGNTLDISVVPTLPVADASNLIKTILTHLNINRLKINYFGSPGADHSGLGRQFASELMQGYVVNQDSLFIRLSGGGMYPYDPSNRNERATLYNYNLLGRFLGLALQLGYPTGQVLSEKAISCMLAFSTKDLDHDFDSKGFFEKMDDQTFIRFMQESTGDDPDSVNLYRKVFISENAYEALESAAEINKVFEDDLLGSLIAGGIGNIQKICDRLQAIWIEDHSFSINALHAMAQGVKQRLPKLIRGREISSWEDVRMLGTMQFSNLLQGELSAQYVKEHIRVRFVGGETPEKSETAQNVRKWTDEWIDANGNDPEKLANFVQAFTGARAITREIYLDINPYYHTIVSHTCYYRADLPVGVREEFVKLMWDDYALGNLKFDVA